MRPLITMAKLQACLLSKVLLPIGDLDSSLIHGCLGTRKSACERASRLGSFVVAGHVIRQCAADDLVVEFVKIGGSCDV